MKDLRVFADQTFNGAARVHGSRLVEEENLAIRFAHDPETDERQPAQATTSVEEVPTQTNTIYGVQRRRSESGTGTEHEDGSVDGGNAQPQNPIGRITSHRGEAVIEDIQQMTAHLQSR